jgi:L-fucose isomerase-like protein
MKYQLIMNRLMEDPTKEPDITRGTLEGQIMPGPITMYRIQGTAEGQIKSYIAQGAILDVDPKSFGGIGIFNIEGFGRFYRQILIGKRFPHHAAVAFGHTGAVLHDALTLLGVEDISFPLLEQTLYPNENPFKIIL